MISKLEIYGIALAVLIAVICGAYFKGRSNGVEAQKLEALQEREQERVRTDKLKEDSDHAWQVRFDAIQTRLDGINSQPHEPIRLCKPSEVRLPAPAGSANAADKGDGPIVSGGPDLYGSILVYATQCEVDRQKLTALQDWVNGVTAK